MIRLEEPFLAKTEVEFCGVISIELVVDVVHEG